MGDQYEGDHQVQHDGVEHCRVWIEKENRWLWVVVTANGNFVCYIASPVRRQFDLVEGRREFSRFVCRYFGGHRLGNSADNISDCVGELSDWAIQLIPQPSSVNWWTEGFHGPVLD